MQSRTSGYKEKKVKERKGKGEVKGTADERGSRKSGSRAVSLLTKFTPFKIAKNS